MEDQSAEAAFTRVMEDKGKWVVQYFDSETGAEITEAQEGQPIDIRLSNPTTTLSVHKLELRCGGRKLKTSRTLNLLGVMISENCQVHIKFKSNEKEVVDVGLTVAPLTEAQLADVENIDPALGLRNKEKLSKEQRARLTDRLLDDADREMQSLVSGGARNVPDVMNYAGEVMGNMDLEGAGGTKEEKKNRLGKMKKLMQMATDALENNEGDMSKTDLKEAVSDGIKNWMKVRKESANIGEDGASAAELAKMKRTLTRMLLKQGGIQ